MDLLTPKQLEEVISTGDYIFVGTIGDTGYIYKGQYPDAHEVIFRQESGMYRIIGSYLTTDGGEE